MEAMWQANRDTNENVWLQAGSFVWRRGTSIVPPTPDTDYICYFGGEFPGYRIARWNQKYGWMDTQGFIVSGEQVLAWAKLPDSDVFRKETQHE